MDRTRYRHVDDAFDTLPPAVSRWYDFYPGTDNVYMGSKTQHVEGFPQSFRNPLPRGYQITGDENHSAHLAELRSGKFEGDIGGEFDMVRKCVIADDRIVTIKDRYVNLGTGHVYEYSGPVLPCASSYMSMPPTPSYTSLAAEGTHAIALCKPTNNVANLATDLVETRQEGLPSLTGVNLWKERTNLARGAGAEYLNQEFGWVPLASDIRNASYAAANAHSILSAYERGSHRVVRRRYEFPVERTENTVRIGSTVPIIPNTVLPSAFYSRFLHSGDLLQTTRTYKRQWFSGAFTYHLPVGYKSHNALVSAAAKAGPLLGIELTPDVVWNATPWTWAVDWFSNMGDVISNTSDMISDGLVMKYGYMMEHTVTSYTYVHGTGNVYTPEDDNNHPRPQIPYTPTQLTTYVERKRRVKATPFGFEVSWDSFTPRQLAITAALGLTRFL